MEDETTRDGSGVAAALFEIAAALREVAAALMARPPAEPAAPRRSPRRNVKSDADTPPENETHLPRYELLVESDVPARWKNGKGAWWRVTTDEGLCVALGAENGVVTNLRSGTRLVVAGNLEEKNGKTVIWARKVDSREDPPF